MRNQPKKSLYQHFMFIGGMSLLVTAGISIGAEPESGHAAAPAAAPSHAAGPAAPAAPSHEAAPIAQPQATPSVSSNHSTSNAKASAANTPLNQQSTGPNHDHGRNHDQQFEYTYGYPWWGYNDGWGSGWYGNGYLPNDDNNNNTSSSNINSTSGSVTQGSAQVASPDQSSQTAVTPAGQRAQMTNAVDKSPMLVEANNAVQAAQSAFDSERERVLANLRNNPDYKQAVAKKHDAAGEVQQAKLASPTTAPVSVAVATEKLDASDEVTKMEEQAIATDPAAQMAKTKLNEAVANRDALRAQLMSSK